MRRLFGASVANASTSGNIGAGLTWSSPMHRGIDEVFQFVSGCGSRGTLL